MTTVDIPALRRVGDAVTGAAPDFRLAHSARAGQLGTGASGDWATTGAATGAAERWGAFLSQLTDQVGRLGADLTASAADFEAADRAAADGVGAAGRPR